MSKETLPGASQVRTRMTIRSLAQKKTENEKIVMVTAYDFFSAGVVDAAGADLVLVGDSAAMTVLGYESTVPVSVEEMLMLTAAARRGVKTAMLVGDLPFGSYEASDSQAVATAQLFVKRAGCDAVKLEGSESSVDRARAIVSAGIPVMGHVGLTPQTAGPPESFSAQGRSAQDALRLLDGAFALEAAGCFSIVLEAVPGVVAVEIARRLSVPVIGIGAGAGADGQVLVFHDLLGLHDTHEPRFVKRYASLRRDMVAAIEAFAADVRDHRYPEARHSYGMPAEEAGLWHEALIGRSDNPHVSGPAYSPRAGRP